MERMGIFNKPRTTVEQQVEPGDQVNILRSIRANLVGHSGRCIGKASPDSSFINTITGIYIIKDSDMEKVL